MMAPTPFARRLHTEVWISFTICLLGACSTGADGDSHFAIDSAGITIVANADADLLEPEACRVQIAATPMLETGVASGDANYQLHRVSGATRLGNGNVVVANSGSHELKQYDAAGRFIRKGGGFGEGPGEFKGLDWIALQRGDTIVTFDTRLNRIAVFDSSLSFVRTVTLAVGDMETAMNPVALDVFDDGTYLASSMIRPQAGLGGMVRTDVYLLRFQADGQHADTIGVFPGRELTVSTGVILHPPFERTTQFVPYNELLYVAPQDEYQIERYDQTGELETLIRKPHDNALITDEHLEAVRWPAQAPQPHSTMPAYESVLIDPLRYLWVLEFAVPGDQAGAMSVFDPEGRFLCTVHLAERFTPLEVGVDYLLGV